MTSKSIAIACDHGGYDLKSLLQNTLEERGYEVLDLGTNGPDSVDYPDFAYELARSIRDGKVSQGVLVCGSGIGISIAVNRYTEVRAALIHDALGAKLSRQHNDANVLCLGGRMIGLELALDCLNIFLTTEFEGGRHARRVEKLSNPI
jgi:ribose 5-phosphate isomerase B